MKSSNEIWKPINGFEGLYEVSNQGRVRSLSHKVLQTGNGGYYWHHYTGRILIPTETTNGYYHVMLTNKKVRKHFLVHRLVAAAFLKNPENLPQINHKNENKKDNRSDNLEWCTAAQNTRHGTLLLRSAQKRAVPVVAEMNGFRFEFSSISEAEKKTKVTHANIVACCRGRRPFAGGFSWHYLDK